VASISYTLNQDIYVLLDLYRADANLEAMFLMNQAIDLSDQISKMHLPAAEFFTLLISRITVIGEIYKYGEAEMAAMNELLEIIKEHRDRYCTNL
jgi:hypothetical protein